MVVKELVAVVIAVATPVVPEIEVRDAVLPADKEAEAEIPLTVA